MKKKLKLFLIFLLVSSISFSQPKEAELHSVVILGGGVGALTSAIYLQRAGINTIVIEGANPGGAIAQSPAVHNWPGEIEIKGQLLVDKIRAQAEANGAKILEKEVISVDFQKTPFSFSIRDIYEPSKIEKIQSRACIIAMGSTPRLLGVPGESGERGYWTRGVYNCAICDGNLFHEKVVAVIGGGDAAILEADYLSKIAKKVYIILRSDRFRTVESLRKEQLLKKENIEILYNTSVEEIQGNGQKVTHLNLSTKKTLPVDGVFLAIGATPNSEIFAGQLDRDEKGYIRLAKGQQTSIPGVFAIGDIVDSTYKQAISAAGDAAKAALELEEYLATSEKSLAPSKKDEIVFSKASNFKIREIESPEELYESIGKEQIPLVIEFYSPHCGPCKQLEQELEKIAIEQTGKIVFLKVDVTRFSDIANSYNIFGIPTLLIFDSQGKMTKKASGLKEIQTVLKDIHKFSK